MRQLGAVWWKSEDDWFMDSISFHDPRIVTRSISTGWPDEGGVWVLIATNTDGGGKSEGMLFNAYTMEERCTWIEKLGGIFYADPKDCPDLDLA